jgi:hypothetical protein
MFRVGVPGGGAPVPNVGNEVPFVLQLDAFQRFIARKNLANSAPVMPLWLKR